MASIMHNAVTIKVEIDDSDTETGKYFSAWKINWLLLNLLSWIRLYLLTELEEPTFYAKRSRHNNIIPPWKPCSLLQSDGTKCTVKYNDDGKEKEVTTFEIARDIIPLPDDIKTVGTRIIARYLFISISWKKPIFRLVQWLWLLVNVLQGIVGHICRTRWTRRERCTWLTVGTRNFIRVSLH